jgi:GH25 family lysozyme M1 (1,4-beta-N-acetylmuramidase)
VALHIPDVSEHQDAVDLAAVGPAVILRAHNGRRPDATFKTRQAAARKHCAVRGFYGYVVDDRDAATQGREFAAVVGRLQEGEFAVCDLEVGAGDRSAHALAWMREVDAACGGRAWLYSGLSYLGDHLEGVKDRRLWVAAYRDEEPATKHVLWQHTDRERHAGVSTPCDCSVYRGTVEQLRALVGAKPHPVAPARWFTRRLCFVDGDRMSGPDVTHVQKRLHLKADGFFGPRTRDAVVAFQRAHGLTPDGVVGPRTAKALG